MEFMRVAVVIVTIGYIVALAPLMRVKEEHGKHMLLCNVSGFEMDSIYFIENSEHVAEVSNKFNNCNVKTATNSLHCRCPADSVIVCDLANKEYPSNCYAWTCSAIHNHILTPSNSVNVCINVENNNSTKKPKSDCSADSTNQSMDTVKWVVDEIHYLKTGILFPTEVYNTENISSLINSIEREDNGSIVVCKVTEDDQPNWNIKILYPPALCTAYFSIPSTNQTCKLANGNPLIEVFRAVNESSECMLGSKTSKPETLKLCDAVNRADVGAKYFVGNETGLFELDILIRASVKEFYLENNNNQTNITFNVTSSITFQCLGHGNPPPEMTLVKDGVEYGRGYSLIKHTVALKGSQDCGKYTCIAAYAFGVNRGAIQISCHKEIDFHQDLPQDATTIIQLIYIVIAAAGALVLIVIIVAVACVYRIYKRMKSTENVVLPMTDLLTTSATASPILVIDQSVIYHEIDPLMIESNRPDVDDSTSDASQPSFNAGTRQYERIRSFATCG